MNEAYRPPAAAPGAYAYPPAEPSAQVSEVAVELLRQTRPWVMLISIVFLVLAGLMVLGGIAMIGVGAVAGAATDHSPFPLWLLGFVYLPVAGFYVYPSLKLWMFARSIGRLLTTRAAEDLENALRQQKSFWKYSGIVLIVAIVGYILALGGMLAAGLAGALHGATG